MARESDDQLVGFSTQVLMKLNVDGRKVRGIFSGDTIIDKRYWGNNDLAKAFYKFCVRNIVFRPPWEPLYWCLISKGYKTYLLMTNNFYNYYPNVNGHDEKYRRITEAYCTQLFPEAFHKENMLLEGELAATQAALKEARAVVAAADAMRAIAATRPDGYYGGREVAAYDRVRAALKRG